MNLFDFEDDIDSVILHRGFSYYQSGLVRSIEETSPNTFTAYVEGSEDYLVKVKLREDGEIIYVECDCPYDWGPICKHMVAVFYELKERLQDNIQKEKKGSGEFLVRSFEGFENNDLFLETLKTYDKEKLIQLIIKITEQYPEIRQWLELVLAVSDLEEERKKAKQFMKSYLRKSKDRDGFIDYKMAKLAAEGANIILENAENILENEEYLRGAELCFCVLEEMVPILEDADDSLGYIGGVIDEAISLIGEIAKSKLTEAEKEALLETIINESLKEIYDGWPDWRFDLWEACIFLVDSEKAQKKFEKILDNYLSEISSSWGRYEEERVVLIKYRLIEKTGGVEKAKSYLEQNRHFPALREMAIKNALVKKDYQKVEALALEGEEIDRGFPGLVAKWQDYRYQVYKRTGQVEKLRNIALIKVYNGSFEHYKELKNTYSKDEWKEVYPNIIKEFEKMKSHWNLYPQILIEEGEKKKLLEFIKKSPAQVTRYYKYLIPDYQFEVYEIFSQYILETAAKASNRKAYREVVSYLRQLIQIDGYGRVQNLIGHLKAKYYRKPAFLEELAKLRI